VTPEQRALTANPFFLGGLGSMMQQILRRNFPDYGIGFQLNIPLRRLFEAPTIAGFGAIIEEALLEEIEKLSQEDAVRRLSEGPAL
jgi:hypothetical protein